LSFLKASNHLLILDLSVFACILPLIVCQCIFRQNLIILERIIARSIIAYLQIKLYGCLVHLLEVFVGVLIYLLLCAGDRDARTSSRSPWRNDAAWQTTIFVLQGTICDSYVVSLHAFWPCLWSLWISWILQRKLGRLLE